MENFIFSVCLLGSQQACEKVLEAYYNHQNNQVYAREIERKAQDIERRYSNYKPYFLVGQSLIERRIVITFNFP